MSCLLLFFALRGSEVECGVPRYVQLRTGGYDLVSFLRINRIENYTHVCAIASYPEKPQAVHDTNNMGNQSKWADSICTAISAPGG